jgi:diaminopimelate epimerase
VGDGIAFVKGHGTENDFVLLPDATGALEIDEALVRAICDRRAGIGADGVIRIAPAGDGRWFMDYRNADGSVAQMCGNGARVFARFLVTAGWAEPGRIDFLTRGGVRVAELGPAGDVRIGMGPVRLGAASVASVVGTGFPGRQVDVGNPHLVCVLDGPDARTRLAGLDLGVAPSIDAAEYPEGANVEFIVRDPAGAGPALTMRVHERGVGETRSCGTGTVAAAATVLDGADGTVTVRVPGGQVTVEMSAGQAWLTGPAVLVASGTLDQGFAAAEG